MRRIAFILLLALLLLPARHSDKRPLPPRTSLDIHIRPVPLDSHDPERRSVGVLGFLGAWELSDDKRLFGGISSLHVADDGGILALNDGGTLFGFDLDGRSGRRSFAAPLPTYPAERDWPIWKWDSESLQYDPASDRYWVGFELIQRICRYAPALSRVDSCTYPPVLSTWPDTGSIEAMTRLPDGRFIALSEMGFGPHGGYDALVFGGDPADPATPAPRHMGYIAPQGYKPTDAVWLGGNRLLVLNRRVTFFDGFTAVLAVVELPVLKEGAMLRAREIARFAPPLLADNFEALALSREGGRTIVWIASDDNHMRFQRNLLLKLSLPAELDPLRPGAHVNY